MITLSAGGREVAAYVVAPDLPATLVPRPYLHPVRTLAGTVVTDERPADHEWHLGAGPAMPDVSGTNLWGGRTYVHGQGYVWRDDHGRIAHRRWTSQDPGSVGHELDWLDPQGRTLLTERRSLTARPRDAASWILELDLDLHNPGIRPMELRSPAANGRGEGAGYGGLFWRLPPTADAAVTAGPLTGEAAVNGSAEPVLTVRGATGAGRYALEFTGLAGDDRWFVRLADYPGVGVALASERPLSLPPGATLRRRFRVAVIDEPSPSSPSDRTTPRGVTR